MNAPAEKAVQDACDVAQAIDQACARIAPTWPLDRFIAVNPYWGWVDQPLEQAAAQLGSLSGARLLMPRSWFGQHWLNGTLRHEHLRSAIMATGSTVDVDALVAAMHADRSDLPSSLLITDLADSQRLPGQVTPWREVVTHQISQHCAAYFDDGQSAWSLDRSAGMYAAWRKQVATDYGLPIRHGHRWFAARVAALSAEPGALISGALSAMRIGGEGRTPYLTALLLSVNGWASWCAYQRWQARLSGRDDDHIVQLLAIRLAWEWLLRDDMDGAVGDASWAARWHNAAAAAQAQAQSQNLDWLLQLAMEHAYQQELCEGLAQAPQRSAPQAPEVQAVFCIDVRSEVFRRALEATTPAVETRGFAGFFGLPIAYSPLGSALTRPQLPGLLAPAQCVTEVCDSPPLGQVIAQRRRQALQWRQRWAEFRHTPASAFSFVETCGLLYGPQLLKDSLPSAADPSSWEDTGLTERERGRLRPVLPRDANNPQSAAGLAESILGAMGLTQSFAPLVLLAGHGSQTANNPHAAGLDCGACGGQTGSVNARVLAELLNDASVRNELRSRGINIPRDTYFIAGLHNTTTDAVELFDLQDIPAEKQAQVQRLRAWLAQAGQSARRERAAALGLHAVAAQPERLEHAVKTRANDWAQVRPEWGLANNAAFIVAPRSRSKHLHLAGRSFLHDYDWRQDSSLGVLELIMTAPMIVTHWINMQYYASSVDNLRYGSGNKVLHNVVGAHLGVFEGNGGDLRIGLPWQSLHDGSTLMHTPLRLSVFIEAPQASIDQIIQKHSTVRQLLNHGWLHLFQIEPDQPRIMRYIGGQWIATMQSGMPAHNPSLAKKNPGPVVAGPGLQRVE
jgi:uncharacterized protein